MPPRLVLLPSPDLDCAECDAGDFGQQVSAAAGDLLEFCRAVGFGQAAHRAGRRAIPY
jgi:hypothetical protein